MRLPVGVAPAGERARKHFVHVVLVIYLLAIFEGSIRKWVLPEYSLYVFFIRDPFLIYAYCIATRNNLWPRRNLFLGISVGMCALGVLVVLLQAIAYGLDDTRILLAAYGWRSYFLYAPLAFLIGAQFRIEDVHRVCRWTLMLTLPIAVLVAAQFWAPLNSPINVGLAADKALQFHGLGLTGEHTRPMGPFSSGAGQIQFVASSFAILLAMLVMPARGRPAGRILIGLAIGGVATCAGLSGSRGTVLHCVLIGVVAMTVAVVGRGAELRLRALLVPFGLFCAALVLYPIAFPEGYDAFAYRWQQADRSESVSFEGGIFGRALYGFVDFGRLLSDVPAFGHGLGYGGNASTTLGARIDGRVPVGLAETDWARHIVDLGPTFGLAYIAFRIALTVWLGRMVLRATRRGAGPLPVLLYGYAGYVLLLGQITGQGAINAYAWLFTGFCIAAASTRFKVWGLQPRAAAQPAAVGAGRLLSRLAGPRR